MSIIFEKETRVFKLDTKRSTYQFQADMYDVLVHLYYGKKVKGDLRHLIRKYDAGFSGNPYEAGLDRTYSFDTLSQEFPSYGVGDYRVGCVGIVEADGSRAADFRYVSHKIKEGAKKPEGMPGLYDMGGEAQTLEVTLSDKSTGVIVELFYTVFEEKDIITRMVKVVNNGEGSIVLEKMLSACLDLPSGEWEMLHFHGRHAMERQMERRQLLHGNMSIGSKRGTSSHQHNPAIILCKPDTTEDHGDCYGMSLVYSSNFIGEVELDQMDQVRAVMGIHPEQFHYILDRGMAFETPQVIMTYTDNGFGELSHIYHRIMSENLCRGKYKSARRPVLINNWEATYFDCTKEKIMSIAKQAAELGVEMLVLDDGWYGKREDDTSGLGDWFVNEEKMGGSLSDLVSQINAQGLKFGIWVEPEMVSEDSDLYRKHPDWALTIPGRKPCRSRSQLVLDLSRPDVVDYIFGCLKEVFSSANIEYVKWDMNRSMCDIYSALSQKENQGEIYHKCMLGLYDLLERVVTTFPNILLEGCSGGGGRFDPAMLYYSPQIWSSDDTDAIERLDIQYGTSFFYPISSVGSHVSASPNHQTGRNTPIETRGVVAMAGSFGYELDLNLLSEEEKHVVKKQIQDFKRYYDVIHSGEYYRLLSPYDNNHITAWESVSKDKSEALVSIVCTHVRANKPAVILKLKGLDEEKYYEIEGMEGIFTGGVLMYGGIVVPVVQGDYPSMQLYLKESENL